MIEFQVVLGGAVVLDCEARLRFGKIDPNTVMAYFDGYPFTCGGILLDYGGDLVTLREYITAVAYTVLSNRKESPNGNETEH